MKQGLRAILFFVLVVVLFFVYDTRANAEGALKLGDVNRDNSVNTGDGTTILRYSVGLCGLSFYSRLAGDVNNDIIINSGDAVLILKYAVTQKPEMIGKPFQLIGDINNPTDYKAFDYSTQLIPDSTEDIVFCEYTVDAVANPHGETAFGIGYSTQLTRGQTVAFETYGSGSVDTRIYVFDSEMNVLAFNDDGGDDLFSRIEFSAGYKSTFNILVCGKSKSNVGAFSLSATNMVLVTPPPTPTPTPTQSIPSPTPSEQPTEVPPIVIPTPDVDTGTFFENDSLPETGEIIQYRKPHVTGGVVTSVHPILSIRVCIYNSFGSIAEISAEVEFSEGDNVLMYSLAQDGADSIDAKLMFATLRFGQKGCVVYCTTTERENIVLFSSRFLVGVCDAALVGNTYTAGTELLGYDERKQIIDSLNNLTEGSVATEAIMNAITRLGVPYGTGSGELDCSSLIQYAYGDLGISLPRTAAEQGRYCHDKNGEYSLDEIIPGDLIFFQEVGCTCGRYMEIHHVALYVGEINDVRYYIEASYSVGRIVLRRAWGETPTSRWRIAFYGRPY